MLHWSQHLLVSVATVTAQGKMVLCVIRYVFFVPLVKQVYSLNLTVNIFSAAALILTFSCFISVNKSADDKCSKSLFLCLKRWNLFIFFCNFMNINTASQNKNKLSVMLDLYIISFSWTYFIIVFYWFKCYK